MALIIKGDMPTCCGLCCECLGGGSDAYYCNRAKRQISEVVPPYDKRMEWCPILGEIPDKHERLIDVDAYIKTEMDDYRKHGDEYSKERAETIADVLAVLDKHTPVVLERTT